MTVMFTSNRKVISFPFNKSNYSKNISIRNYFNVYSVVSQASVIVMLRGKIFGKKENKTIAIIRNKHKASRWPDLHCLGISGRVGCVVCVPVTRQALPVLL